MSLDLSRRGFLRLFGAAAVGMALDPDLALWVPGQKTIFLPSETVFKGNQFLTIQMITGEALAMMKGQLALLDGLHRQWGAWPEEESGYAISLKTPTRYDIWNPDFAVKVRA
ncbi:MAG: twin-arginine translocation signal domain-containing protein [Acidobacteria bacterium]|nr:twin-arginine translocation signal domain-containing protein [Acidobacteriota bacterium]